MDTFLRQNLVKERRCQTDLPLSLVTSINSKYLIIWVKPLRPTKRPTIYPLKTETYKAERIRQVTSPVPLVKEIMDPQTTCPVYLIAM